MTLPFFEMINDKLSHLTSCLQ